MTDEQWLWLFINESIDYDEKLEHMCSKCQDDATSNNCMRCGKSLGKSNSKFTPQSVNPSFDVERFNTLANGTDIEELDYEDETDYKLIDQLMNIDNIKE